MSLAALWFFILGVLWAAWIATDGFDLGVGILYPFIGKTPGEKSQLIKSIAPLWDGNEVWLITAAGATFAAFPAVYAALFSFMYLLFALLLFSLILRGVALEFIYKGQGELWLKTWGMLFFIGSISAPLLFGLIFGNIFQGLSFDTAGFRGGFTSLINPLSILTGSLMVILCILHGSLWIFMNTEGSLKSRARSTSSFAWSIALVVLIMFVAEIPIFSGLHKNYLKYPVTFILPVMLIGSFICIRLFMAKGRPGVAFACSIFFIITLFLGAFAGLYPYFLPSLIDPDESLNVSGAASGNNTLVIMTGVAVVMVPVVIACQAFVYRVFRFKDK
jgi:cytochrome bd ubiquinol oxidase subunit II